MEDEASINSNFVNCSKITSALQGDCLSKTCLDVDEHNKAKVTGANDKKTSTNRKYQKKRANYKKRLNKKKSLSAPSDSKDTANNVDKQTGSNQNAGLDDSSADKADGDLQENQDLQKQDSHKKRNQKRIYSNHSGRKHHYPNRKISPHFQPQFEGQPIMLYSQDGVPVVVHPAFGGPALKQLNDSIQKNSNTKNENFSSAYRPEILPIAYQTPLNVRANPNFRDNQKLTNHHPNKGGKFKGYFGRNPFPKHLTKPSDMQNDKDSNKTFAEGSSSDMNVGKTNSATNQDENSTLISEIN